MKKKLLSLLALVCMTLTASAFDLSVGTSEHGSIVFKVNGNEVQTADEGDVVTVVVTPATGYVVNEVSGQWYAAAAAARKHSPSIDLLSAVELTPVQNAENQWTFTMARANVDISATYKKLLQDAWIQDIADETYTGEAIEPIITVKDGETVLTLDTDYTVSYSNNVADGTATVTVTGMGDYSGTATATFTILTDKSTLNTVIADAENYYNSIKDSNAAIAAELLTAINTAKDVKDNADARQTEVEAATTALNDAVTAATVKTALDNAINEAEAYYEQIKDVNPFLAEDMSTSINYAKRIQAGGTATREEIEYCVDELQFFIMLAEEEIGLKRVNFTIPAKSYTTYIDADKRKLDDAELLMEEGVSLYTITAINGKDVVLSALNVANAYMPFLIYNDSDEAKTFSIVVSEEPADDVTVADEFQGTLEAKEMPGSGNGTDYYVLSNGHNFVWVKDAGIVGANNCWLAISDTGAAEYAHTLNFVFDDEATGVSPIDNCYDLTVAPNGYGTVGFSVGSTVATTAEAGEVVTITVTPDEGYTTKGLTARAYTSWGAAGVRRAPALIDDISVTKQQDGTWTFTMPEANVEVEVEYYICLLETNDDSWLFANDGQTADIQLGRTLQTDSWNTLALPFTVEAATLGISAAKELESATLEDGVLTLNFTDATVIEAGKPYLVKVAENVVNPTFDAVLVSDAIVPTETAVVDFIPTLGATTIEGDDAKTVLFLAAGNRLLTPTVLPADIKGFRAYFQLKGEAAGVKSFQLNLGEDEATGIQTIDNGQLTMDNEVYDLQGRRMNKAAQKGVYIVNGKKTIIK